MDYTLVRPVGLLAHYTTGEAAFDHILPERRLRLSPYGLMGDPAENKDIQPSISSSRDGSEADRAIEEAYAQLKTVRDAMRVLSLSTDAVEPTGVLPAFSSCWARPRMWEQYGDAHRGVCLLFDRLRLEDMIIATWPGEQTYVGTVDYARDGGIQAGRRMLDADLVLSDDQPDRAIRAYLDANRDAYFFLKSDDFATEYEYRVVLSRSSDRYAYVDCSDSLVAVVLGERFPYEQPAATKPTSTTDVKLGKMHWRHGRPHVLPESSVSRLA